MDMTKQLLLNLSLLLVIQFFFQVWVDSLGNKKIPYSIAMIFLLLSVFCSISLSIQVNHDYRLDLRQVPLIIGGLYGGSLATLFLYAATLIIRAFFGVNIGFWATSLSFGIQAILVAAYRKRFLSLSFKRKTVVSMIMSILSSLLLLLTLNMMYAPQFDLKLLLNYIIIPALGTGIMIYTIESWIRNRCLHKKIIKSEKMEVISHLSASIAHEIRNPLTTVQGFLQLIKKNEFNDQKRMEFAEIALKEIEQTESIISDFLTFAKPSINYIEELDVCNELQQILNIMKPLANMNSVRMATDFRSCGQIKADKTLFQQCIVNLCKNALEAMEKGGTLTIATEENGTSLMIKIVDTGVGMTEEQLQHLGEPYFTLKGNKGTGLGVMVIYSIVQAFKGTIDVKSNLGEGTTFILSFPLAGEKRSFQPSQEVY